VRPYGGRATGSSVSSWFVWVLRSGPNNTLRIYGFEYSAFEQFSVTRSAHVILVQDFLVMWRADQLNGLAHVRAFLTHTAISLHRCSYKFFHRRFSSSTSVARAEAKFQIWRHSNELKVLLMVVDSSIYQDVHRPRPESSSYFLPRTRCSEDRIVQILRP
jgi:hypothetical protein